MNEWLTELIRMSILLTELIRMSKLLKTNCKGNLNSIF